MLNDVMEHTQQQEGVYMNIKIFSTLFSPLFLHFFST
jgi:hypothetical protein